MTTLLRGDGEVTVSVAEQATVAGQPLEVTVRFTADRALEVAGGEVELVRRGSVAHFERGWTGAGGTVSFRRVAVLDRTPLDVAGSLVAGQRLARTVTMRVPPGEATVDAYLVQQTYELRARLRLSHGRAREGATSVHVLCSAAGHGWVATTEPVTDDAGFAVLSIEELATRRMYAGAPITGVVTVTPRQVGSARGVRVELLLAECVPARTAEVPVEEDRTAATVMATAALADRVHLEPGRVLRLPFTLRAPLPLPAPSIGAPEFTLRWLLRAVLDRPRHPDPTTTIELWAPTAP